MIIQRQIPPKYSFSFTLYFLILSLLLSLSHSQETKKISSVNLLLPICPDCNKVVGSISAEGGCFTWSTDRTDLVRLQEIQKRSDHKGCKSKVLVSPKTENIKDYTFVNARELKSNEVFKCKVGFAKIDKIVIEKSFDRLNVGEDFELEVKAHDERGNLFSSLEGWKFNWRIIEGAEFAEIQKLQEHGKKRIGKGRKFAEETAFADIVIVKGKNTGKIKIEVELLEGKYKLKSTKSLYIVEPFKIYPPGPLYFYRDTSFNLDIYLTESKRFIKEEEKKFYKWKVVNNCCRIEDNGRFQTLKNTCDEIVIARDTRLENYNEDSVNVKVVVPDQLKVVYKPISPKEKEDFHEGNLKRFQYEEFYPSTFWQFVEKKHYLIQNFLLYNGNPVIYDTTKLNFKNNFHSISPYIEEGKAFYSRMEKDRCQISTETYCKEEKEIDSSISLYYGDPLLVSRNKVIIYQQVKIEKYGMPFFTLPLFENSKIDKQELYLNVTGGSGIYSYISENPSVIGIGQHYVYSNTQLGESEITVYDKEVRENNDTVKIRTKNINVLTYFEERQEIQVNHQFEVTPVALHDLGLKYEYHPHNIFTNCSRLSFSYEINLKDSVSEIKEVFMDKNDKLKSYISNNGEAIQNKMKYNKPNGIDILKFADYFNYASFGICGINYFKGLNEGLVKVNYRTYQNLAEQSSLNPAQIYLYYPLEHFPVLKDGFTNKLIEKGNIGHPDKEKLFIIPKGLTLTIRFKGGVSQWSEYKSQYSEQIYAFDKHSNEISLSNFKDYIGGKTYENKKIVLSCFKNEFENMLQYSISNKPDKTLLKPAKTIFNFKFGCAEPKSLSMFILSHENNMAIPMYGHPQKRGLKYFEEKNYTDIVRVYAFDDTHRLLCNISLLTGSWKIYSESDRRVNINNFYEIVHKKNYAKYNNITSNPYIKEYNEFIQDVFFFKNFTSTFNIQYSLKKDMLNHHLIISTIDIPKLVPDAADIYFRRKQPFEISIEGGSGSFKVECLNPEIANIKYIPGSRKILLQPNSRGVVVINLIDYFISRSVIQGKYNLIDIQELIIQESDIIMVNKTSEIPIKAIDTFGHEIKKDQLIDLPLAIDDYQKTKDIYFTFNKNKTHILATGFIAGNYQVKIKDINTDVESNFCKIEVFNALEIFPPYLLLVPGSSYTLSVRGGPSNKDQIQLKYFIDDPKIAEVASEDYPLVRANLTGETILRVTLSYKYKGEKLYLKDEDSTLLKKKNILCVEEVPVTVDFPEKAGIIYADGNRKVYTGATIRLFSALKKGDKVFTYGVGPFTYFWQVEPARIAKMEYYIKTNTFEGEGDTMLCDSLEKDKCSSLVKSEIDKDPSGSIGVFLKTINEGTVSIKLKIHIKYPFPYERHNKNEFLAEAKIIINDEIFFNLPEFYGNNPKSSGIYLIPMDIEHELSTNKKITSNYKIVQQYDKETPSIKNPQIISITSTGRVTSYLKKGLAYVLISHQDNPENMNNNVPVTLPIYVTEFYSIFIERTDQLIEIKAGQEINLKVIIQHESGLLFAEKFDRMKLRVIESHPKVATSELIESNSLLKIKSHSLGMTNIILFHPITRRIYDVFRIWVSQDVSTMGKIIINVGGNINFMEKNIDFKKKMTKNSVWLSENPDIMSIDKYTGKAKAIQEGEVVINLKSGDGKKIIYSAKVEVKRIFSVQLDRSYAPEALTDIKTNDNFRSSFKMPIDFYTEAGEKFTRNSNDTYNIIDHGVRIKCISENTDFVVAKHEKEEDHECFVSIRDSKYRPGTIKPKDVQIKLNIETLSPYNKKYRGTKETVEKFPFSSSFRIKNNIKELNFTHTLRKHMIHIDNLNDLTFTQSDPELFTYEENMQQNLIYVTIPKKVVNEFFGEKLTITNILSGQKEEIIINFKRASSSRFFFGLISLEGFTDVLTLIFLIVILFVLLSYYLKTNNIMGTLFGPGFGQTPENNMNNYNAYNQRGYQPSSIHNNYY